MELLGDFGPVGKPSRRTTTMSATPRSDTENEITNKALSELLEDLRAGSSPLSLQRVRRRSVDVVASLTSRKIVNGFVKRDDFIADDENCGLWLTNLPPDVTSEILLNRLHVDAGQIRAVRISPPNRNSLSSAATMVCIDRGTADRLVTAVRSGEVTVGRCYPEICFNRVKVRAQ